MLAQELAQWAPVLQYGAFGLCLFFGTGFFGLVCLILRGHRSERKGLVDSLDARAEDLKSLYLGSQRALDNNADAVRRLSEALKDRPCLAADSRVGTQRPRKADG